MIESALDHTKARISFIDSCGVRYWASYAPVWEVWLCLAQKEGFPATAASSEQFKYEKDAIDLCRVLSRIR